MIPIVKLKGLPLSAKSKDIRALFNGLLIPDGAVHVIGGPEGLAFIAFGTFEDAKQAIAFSHAEIHGCPIVTEWSTDAEMCEVISEILRTRNQGILTNELADHSSCKAFNNWRSGEMQVESPVSCYQDSSYYGSSSTSPYSGLNYGSQKSDDIRESNFFKQQMLVKSYQMNEHFLPASSIHIATGTSAESVSKREQQEKQKFYYVRLSNFPAEISTTAALEAFLNPSVPLRLSSVKTIFDRNRFPYCFLVRLENVDDMQNALDKDGEKGIKIQACSQAYFNNAVDGSVRKAKIDGGKVECYSSDDESTVKREKKNVSGKAKSVIVRSCSRSPEFGSKHPELKRTERERSPEQRHNEATISSRKRKEKSSEHDRRNEYDRMSPKQRWKKTSPRKRDHSPGSKKSDKENGHFPEISDGNKDLSQNGSETSNRRTERSEASEGLYANLLEKDSRQIFEADELPPSIELMKRKKYVQTGQQHDVNPTLVLNSSYFSLGCVPESAKSKPCQPKIVEENSITPLESEDISKNKRKLGQKVAEYEVKLSAGGSSFSAENNQLSSKCSDCGAINGRRTKSTENACDVKVGSQFCVEFTNLPLSVTEDEVKDYLGCLCSNASIRRACFRDGKPSDRWIAVFDSEESAERALLEQEAELLLEGAKQVNPSVKESAQKDLSKIKFSITKEKLAVKPKQEKPSLNPQDNLASNSHVEDKVEVECTTSTVGKNDTNKALTNEVGNNYQGPTYGSRNEQLWHLYNQYCQTYYATTNGPIDYMQSSVHGIHPGRGRPVLIPNGPAEFCAPYQYLGACFPSQGIEQIPFGNLHSSKYLQRGILPRFRSPATYSASPLLYKRRGAGGYEAKGVLNSDKNEKQKCHDTVGTTKDIVYPIATDTDKVETEKIEAK